jgi:hypothetical protein
MGYNPHMSIPHPIPALRNADDPAAGLLFIGDPHLWSRQPGRRRDVRFMSTVLGKLAQAAKIANEKNLQALILGDLLHDDSDHDPEMLIGLTRVLQMFNRKPVCLVGNHDKDELWLSERNALLLLEVAGQIELIDRPRFWGKLLIGDGKKQATIAIGGTPYGADIPADVSAFLTQEANERSEHRKAHTLLDADWVIWMTHDDLAFEGAYPGARDLSEILGVDIAVNGHMHGTTLPHKLGNTHWYNPGNITRMSVDMANHIPSVWAWSPFDEQPMASAQGVRVPRLERIVLEHVQANDIFDFEGRHARASAKLPEIEPAVGSAFVAHIKQEKMGDKTDDAVFIREALEKIMIERKTMAGPRRTLERLLQNVTDMDAG